MKTNNAHSHQEFEISDFFRPLHYLQIVCLCFSPTLHKTLSCILTSSGPVYTHKMLLFHLISFSVIVVAVVLLFLSSSVTTLQGSPLTICCAYRLLLSRYTLPLKTETSQVEFSHLNFLYGRPSSSSFYESR